jgi:hypothetical protein
MPKKEAKKAKGSEDMPDRQENKLPDYLELQRTRVVCKADAPIHVSIYALPLFLAFAFIVYLTCLLIFCTHYVFWQDYFALGPDFTEKYG